MKLKILNLEFDSKYFYIQSESIVEKITFNNRSFYSKFKRVQAPITAPLLSQHYNNDLTLALPLIKENNSVDYLVIEYQNSDWKTFQSLLQYLLKSLHIKQYFPYYNSNKELFQLFIKREKNDLESAYLEVENIKSLLNLKSKKSYKIYPNINLPKNYNIITLPIQKV